MTVPEAGDSPEGRAGVMLPSSTYTKRSALCRCGWEISPGAKSTISTMHASRPHRPCLGCHCRASDCTGPVIMGECKGAIMDPLQPAATCHGTMLNGQCTGPMF